MIEPTQAAGATQLPVTWWSLVTAAFSGGLALKILEYLISWIKYQLKEKKDAKSLVDKHLDPLLKTADAICGKTISLAERDFSSPKGTIESELLGLTYLYAAFWSRLVILDRESLGVSLNEDARGKKLVAFRSCLESQRIRLVDKTHQIAIGEIATEISAASLRTSTIIDFTQRIKDPQFSDWLEPLKTELNNIRVKKTRQRILVYGIVLHAMIDTLDEKHVSSHVRKAHPNKLSISSKQTIKHLVFARYLKGVGAVNRYTE
ncbi:hypothetical protein ISN35_05780 [Xanthomonas translucens pv. undulosa]|uniref:hypothetical protein n=1 Tax=Xanthomonas translucens group TaxID=3390202 RepID=UPI000B2926E3|nr:hypothetical protein [Xanthomonas translucens]QSQ42060.1 hypothetical protein ISN33_02040 [Xanthomonas translucens pv. translucens]QSQ50094.1 hypothetical protein ISN35_05780 [Xanthomonas translucens pv. undulosa]QSQ52484.1 hypothetical protein ISN36_17810 [Xanthomonas translucens pv. undulosa]QSQ58596.1 hypothetical protein ISN38_09930 [Xanthomonas translucens pv. undulosa]UKE73470.1 hypothetical protein KFS85_00365 [Xanthomonas translucens pv. phleipratensis]